VQNEHPLNVLQQRQYAVADYLAGKADAGDEAFGLLVAEGLLAEIAANIEYSAKFRNRWARYLK